MITCPTAFPPADSVLLAHGEGARLTRRLIRDVLLAALDNDLLRPLADAATLPAVDGRLVLTTDSYVVSPLFFPGGDIGSLAVHGTLNDLAVCGAEPICLSLALILEEGLPLETLRRVVGSIRDTAAACRVPVATGDTKVVPRGAVDGLFVNTTALGQLRPGIDLGSHRVRPGDRILVSGTVGDHGIAILSAREGLELEGAVASDTAWLQPLVASLLDAGIDVHWLRDPTRGGVSASLHELAESAGVGILVDEAAVPLSAPVRGACEILGLDPLYVANEGKLLGVVSAADADRARACLRRHPAGASAAIIGQVTAGNPQVLVRGPLGALRVLDEPAGAPLPRIC
jgi:hydrogenase expression/formation protein HypE